jgi:plastocyanin
MRQARLDSAKRQERVLRRGTFPGRRGGPRGRPRAGTSPAPTTIASSIRPGRCGVALALGVAGLLVAALLPADQTVTVGPGMSFTPATVTVVPGETVTWTWAGAPHSSTSNATSGPEFWDSGVLSTGTFSHLFSTPGTYPYYCIIHSSPAGTAMNGVVQVILPATPTPTSTPTPLPTSAPPATPTPQSSSNAIPTLTESGLLALGVGLGVTGALLLLLARRL